MCALSARRCVLLLYLFPSCVAALHFPSEKHCQMFMPMPKVQSLDNRSVCYYRTRFLSLCAACAIALVKILYALHHYSQALQRSPVPVYWAATPAFMAYSGGLYDGGTECAALLAGTSTSSTSTATSTSSASGAGPVNHAMLVVGYDVSDLAAPFFIVKNSWGAGWGMNGYAYVAINALTQPGTCAMLHLPPVSPSLNWRVMPREWAPAMPAPPPPGNGTAGNETSNSTWVPPSPPRPPPAPPMPRPPPLGK